MILSSTTLNMEVLFLKAVALKGRRPEQPMCRLIAGYMRRWTAWLLWAIFARLCPVCARGHVLSAHAWLKKPVWRWTLMPQAKCPPRCGHYAQSLLRNWKPRPAFQKAALRKSMPELDILPAIPWLTTIILPKHSRKILEGRSEKA